MPKSMIRTKLFSSYKITHIKKIKEKIFNFFSFISENGPGERKTLKACEYFNMENALIPDFYNSVLKALQIFGNVLCEKVCEAKYLTPVVGGF